MTSKEILSLLKKKYSEPAWVFFNEVSDATGLNVSRRADGLAMSIWPSRGLFIHGFEIKISRSDWLKELNNPKKSDAIQKYCDHWWIIAPENIIQAGELPPTWGLQVIKNNKLMVTDQAPKLECENISRSFIASIFRKFQDNRKDILLKEFLRGQEERKQEVSEDDSYFKKKYELLNRDFTDFKESLKRFEEKSGVKIGIYDGGPLGEAVQFLLKNKYIDTSYLFDRLKGSLQSLTETVERNSEIIKKIKEFNI